MVMSLYSIIHDQAAIRDGLRERVVKPPICFGRIKAPSLAANPRIVGAAFDYLLRFFFSISTVLRNQEDGLLNLVLRV